MYKLFFIIAALVLSSYADELWSFTQKGRSLYNGEEYEKALEMFDSALVVTPSSQEAQFNRALTMAQLGQVGDAKKVLDNLSFEDSTKQSELSYTLGKVAELEGDIAVQEQDFSSAKEAYSEALSHYASTLANDGTHQKALQNIERTASHLERLPEPEENEDQENQDQENEDQENQDQENEDQENQDEENEDQENQDEENEDQENQDEENEDQEDESDEEENQDEDEDESEEEEKEDEQEQEQNSGEDEQEDPKDQPQPEEQSEEAINALQLLDRFGDDAKELNRPPEGEAQSISGGKDW